MAADIGRPQMTQMDADGALDLVAHTGAPARPDVVKDRGVQHDPKNICINLRYLRPHKSAFIDGEGTGPWR
jgi:hypothetical protein